MPPRSREQGLGQTGRQGRGAAAGGAAGHASADPPQLVRLSEAVPLINTVSAHLLGLPEAGRLPSMRQLEALRTSFQDAVAGRLLHMETSYLAQVLSDPLVMPALLRLTAAAVHWSPEEQWVEGAGAPRPAALDMLSTATAGVELLSLLCPDQAHDDTAPHLLRVCRTLLRMRVLHSTARQLAETAAFVRSGRPMPHPDDLLHPVQTISLLLSVLNRALPHAVGTTDRRLAAGFAALCVQESEALRSSRVLEHAAQLLVVLAARNDVDHAFVSVLSTRLTKLFCCSIRVWNFCYRAQHEGALSAPVSAAAKGLATALRPPCLQYLLLAGGLLALREADGGPVYGLDTQLYGRLFDDLPWRTLQMDRSTQLWWLLGAEMGDALSAPVLPLHAWVAVLLRIAAATVAWEDPVRTSGPKGRDYRAVADVALKRVQPLLGHPALLPEQREEAWRLLLRMGSFELGSPTHVQPSAGYKSLLATYCATLQPGAPAGIDAAHAALSAGVLNFLERTLRVACRSAHAAPACGSVAAALLEPLPLLRLLTHGSPREVAALAITLRKLLVVAQIDALGGPCNYFNGLTMTAVKCGMRLLRAMRDLAPWVPVPVPLAESQPAAAAAAAPDAAASTELQQLRAAGAAEAAAQAPPPAADQGAGRQAAAAEEESPPPAAWPQLTLALLEVSSGLSAWLLRAEAELPGLVAAADGGSEGHKAVRQLVIGVQVDILWACCVLLQRYGPTQDGRMDSVQLDEQVGSSDGGGGSCWRTELLQRVRVVELVAATLRFFAQVLRRRSEDPVAKLASTCLPILALTACRTARAFPQQVREAVLRGPPGGGGGSSAGAASGSAGPGVSGSGPVGGPAWPVHELLPHIQQCGDEGVTGWAAWLAERLRGWAVAQEGVGSAPDVDLVRAPPLTSVAAARSLLRTCSYPGCANLEGDSEADARLQACARCGGEWYCGRACQVAQWKAGHKEECVRRQGVPGVGPT